MNIRNTGIAAITLIAALGATGTNAYAQRPDWNRNRGGRPPFTGRNPGDKVSDQRMRDARKKIEQAQNHLRMALPIYDGNRVDAIQLAELAQWEIDTGLAWDRWKEQGRISNFRKEREGRRGRTSNEQVRRSNEHLMEASRMLDDAIRLLDRAQPDYGGHRAKAIDATRKSIQQIREALRSV
ncbi:MAG: hypothetical protein QM758_29595 [Armatimonas sp.]